MAMVAFLLNGRPKVVLVFAGIAFLFGVMLILSGHTMSGFAASGDDVRVFVTEPRGKELSNTDPGGGIVHTPVRVAQRGATHPLVAGRKGSATSTKHRNVSAHHSVNTLTVDTPSSIIFPTERRRMRRFGASSRTDFPQHDRDRFVNGAPSNNNNGGDAFHPSLIRWWNTRYRVAEVPFTAGAEGRGQVPDRRRHLRYPSGPPGLYQFYDSAKEVNSLFVPYAEWSHATPAEKEVWGRRGPSAPAALRAQDVTPPLLDYAHVRCGEGGPRIRSAALATLLGRTRVSAVIEDAGRCVAPFLSLSASEDTLASASAFASMPAKGPGGDREHMVGGLVRAVSGAAEGSSASSASGNDGAGRTAKWRAVVSQWLFVHAPAWYVADIVTSPLVVPSTSSSAGGAAVTRLSLRRRVKALHFAVTGGNDRRAAYVEHSWGQRTPILWFGDAWLPSLRPITAAGEHSKYKADAFGMLSFKMSRVWEIIYRDYYCGGPEEGGAETLRSPQTADGGGGSGSAMGLFDATEADDTYDDAVGDAFAPLSPNGCPKRQARGGAVYVRRADRFGPRALAISVARRVLRARGIVGAPPSPSSAPSDPFAYTIIGGGNYDWYIRLWDDNYYFEENLSNIVGRLDADAAKVMVGKIGWRNMGKDAVFPFAGGGAGWFLSKAGMRAVGPSFAPPSASESELAADPPAPYAPGGLNPTLSGEEWFSAFRDRRDIFMKHGLHNEDVFLTAWFALMNVTMWNVPGVEHVSPGMWPKQRCMSDLALFRLRWEGWAVGDSAGSPASRLPFSPLSSGNAGGGESATKDAAAVAYDGAESASVYASLFYDYPVPDPRFLLEEPPHSYAKPLVWHYMSPTRLVGLERALYAEALEKQRAAEPAGASEWAPLWGPPALSLPKTASDKPPKARSRKKSCYAGVPQIQKATGEWVREVPPAGGSIFEKLLSDPPLLSSPSEVWLTGDSDGDE